MPGPRAKLELPGGHRRGSQPLGEATRGKTAPNRLRRLDLWLLRTEGALLCRPGEAPFVDLGYGRLPLTTLESARALRELNPELAVLGVEVEPERVEAARRWEDARTRFARGGFDLPLRGEGARIVRAMNVLRQYEESAVEAAWALLGRQMVEGGLLIEGTCDPFGRRMAVQLLRRRGGELVDEGLLFSTNFRGEELRPPVFQSVLPKRWIHRVRPGEPIDEFLRDWERADREAPAGFGPRQRWVGAAASLRGMGWDVTRSSWLLRRGFLAVRGLLERSAG